MYKFPALEEKISRGDLRGAMQGLLVILADYRKETGKKVRVVFDGKKESGVDLREEKVKGIEVFYSIDVTADSIIMKLIKNDPQANQVTVVSSDKEIVSYVNRFRAPFMHSEYFAELVNTVLGPKAETDLPEKDENVNLSNDELSFWEKLFSRK